MRILCGFEFRKMIRSRFNQIMMVLGLALAVFVTVTRILGVHIRDEENDNYISGKKAVEAMMENDNHQADRLTSEYVTRFLKEYQDMARSEDDSNALDYFFQNVNLFTVIGSTCAKVNGNWSPYTLLDIDTSKTLDFYQLRKEKVEYYLNEGNRFGAMSETEKQYWRDRSEQVTTPFAWGGTKVCNILWDETSDLFFLLFVIVICLSPVFSGEYSNRTDAVLLATKYGKSRLIGAKIIVSLLFTAGYLIVAGVVSVGATAIYLGMQGWNLPVQLWTVLIPYDWTIGKTILVNFGVILLIALAMTAFTLMLSSRLKSSLAALAINVVMLTGVSYIPCSKTNRLLNKILFLMPERCHGMKSVLGQFIGYQFGSKIVPYVSMIVLTYSILFLVCLLLIGNGFRKHQVGSR